MMSAIGSTVNLPIDLGVHLPFLRTMNPLSSSFCTISNIGADIHRLPVGTLLLRPLSTLYCVLLLDAILLMKVPKNFALFSLALVINVFSTDSSSLMFAKKSLISLRIS